MNSTPLLPTQSGERIRSLDILRGIAILGILIMNIQSFSMPGAAYMNPMAYGDMTGVNKWIWNLSHVFGDQKFMTIFSILFGAGIALMTSKVEHRGESSAGLHYRRMFWLLVIGLIHAHIFWSGDILVPYALCGLFVFLFRKMKSRNLLILGLIFILVHTFLYLMFGYSLEFWPPESIQEVKASWAPDQATIQAEIAALTGSLSEQISFNSKTAFFMETFVFLVMFLWRAGGLMLVGMALYKTGVLSASKSKSFYIKWAMISLPVGFAIVVMGMFQNYQADWSMEYSMYIGSQFNYIGSLLISFGYICLIMLWSKSNSAKWFKARFASIGQMALTNYLLQTLICVFIFFGFGFGLFGHIERSGQVLIMLIIWLIQFFWSKPWLERFYYGPFEWLWRSLSYRKLQAFRK